MKTSQSLTNYPDRKNKRIVLVDDKPDIIYSVEKVLEDNGFVIDLYTNPTLAVSNSKPGLYNLLLLDIKMPDMDGFDLYEKMRKIDSNFKVCFLTVSSFFYEEYRRRLNAYPKLEKEKKCFIQKPCANAELIRTINETYAIIEIYRRPFHPIPRIAFGSSSKT